MPFDILFGHIKVGIMFRVIDDGIDGSLVEGTDIISDFAIEPIMPALESIVWLGGITNEISILDSIRAEPSLFWISGQIFK